MSESSRSRSSGSRSSRSSSSGASEKESGTNSSDSGDEWIGPSIPILGDNENQKENDNDSENKDDARSDQEEEEMVGPVPTKQEDAEKKEEEEEEEEPSVEAIQPAAKKSKLTQKQKQESESDAVFVSNLPGADNYEKSYMHRETISHLVVTRQTDFIVSASLDGNVKFWKKQETGIEFVKHFRAHLAPIVDMCDNFAGTLLATVSADKSLKVFDVINFDMINMFRLVFTPYACSFVHSDKDPIAAVCVSDREHPILRVFDAKGSSHEPVHTLDKLHYQPVHLMRYNALHDVCVSTDRSGMIEYWGGASNDFKFPDSVVRFDSKMDTDLYEFAKCKTQVLSIAFEPNEGKRMAVMARDRRIRIFDFLTARIERTVDESIDVYSAMQQASQQLGNMEFGRRVAIEKDIDRNEANFFNNLIFDESGHFLIYTTLLGVKILNVASGETVRFLGKHENARFLHCGLFQGVTNKPKAILTIEMKASNNPNLQVIKQDPTIFCTAYKKNRFYLFSDREPDDIKSGESERDVFNEKPTKEEIVAATEESTMSRLASNVIIHTTMGDIGVSLYFKEVPKTVENFAVHSRDGYYNGHIFHRVIKQFMVQTGDPTGTGTGGKSIWGGEFEDEFHPNLKHDKPYTLSMANAGPNTNGSQFFITVIPCPWLDKKHTVFGRVTKGMDVVQKLSMAKVDKHDKPLSEIKIISISVK